MDPFETLINVQAKEMVWEYLHKTKQKTQEASEL